MTGTTRIRLSSIVTLLCASLLTGAGARAATKTLDLDGNAANGAESQCDVNVLQTFPVMIENRVTNKTGGDAFNFVWPSAGPGGFASSVPAGTTGGVGAKWVWTTNQSVFGFTGNSCASDICFSKTGGPDAIPGTCSLCRDDGVAFAIAKGATPGEAALSWQGGQGPFGVYRSTSARTIADAASLLATTDQLAYSDVPPAGTIFFYQVRATSCVVRTSCGTDADCNQALDGTCVSRGPFGVPGRSLFASSVTVSSASLTSSLITFFSPPKEVFRATSTASPGGVAETVTNSGTAPVTVTTPAYPPGCCPANPDAPHQLRCGETCVDYLSDPSNCGACGNVCGEGTCCSNGNCTSLCAEGQTWCGGACADLEDDNDNCGGCGVICGDGTCCNAGSCVSLCGEGQVWCDNQCVDFQNDSGSCGACGSACGDGTCCDGGSCASLCAEGRAWCANACADFQNDSANCGACGNACGDGTCCNAGACESFCAAGQVLCGTECVDFQNDSANCGACGNACGDGTCCNGGSCVSVCAEGQVWCNGQCVDLNNDSANCGACGSACGEGTCCNAGACESFCPAGQVLCGTECVDFQSDSANCGACGNTCGDGTCCNAGVCESFCGEGQVWCNGQCVDPNNDSANCGACGNACGEGTCCNAGACESFCPAGQVLCGTECVDFQNDSANCGACGNACGDGTCCHTGACESVCDEGQVWCNGQCVDLNNDSANCGACGNACGDGTCCNAGACESFCPAGQVLCGTECVDFQSDSANCGACGNTCGDGTCCNQGTCASVCGAGRAWCNGQCVDIRYDNGNCGACGNTCGDGSCCNAGACASVCPAGRTLCGGFCVDLQRDPRNCGACGNVCGHDSFDDNECSHGHCEHDAAYNPSLDPAPIPAVCPYPIPPDPLPGFCPNPAPTTPTPGYCHNESPTNPVPGSCHNPTPTNPTPGYCHNATPTDPVPGSCHNPAPTNPTPGYCRNATPTNPVPGSCPNENPTDPTPGYCHNETPADPVPGSCPNETPSEPVPGACPNTHPSSGPVSGVCPEPGTPAPRADETPVCTVEETTQTIPPGGSATTCTPGGVLFKEVPTAISVCGDGIPGIDGLCNDGTSKVTTGTFNRLVPELSVPIGNAFVTPYSVHVVADTSNDGLIQPGESANLVIDVLNAGPMNITQANGILSAPAVDLTNDGVANPVGITVGTAPSSYGTIFGTPVSTDCTAPPPQKASNATVFPITVPLSHPGDTSHPLVLAVNGTVNGGPFSMNVPLSIGIADKCDYYAHTRDYDGLDGLSSPMAKLVPLGETVPFPSNSFTAGNTRPLKLRMLCGCVNLDDASVDPPQIVGLSEATRGELDISALNLNSDNGTNPNDPFFRFDHSLDAGGQWKYSMRTSLIGTGTFTLRIRIAGRKVYAAGFVLR